MAITHKGTLSNDFIRGSSGNDSIHGLAGDDTLFGEDGNDYFLGGLGNDVMSGGRGQDTFYFSRLDGGPDVRDVIRDFDNDIIFLSPTYVHPEDIHITQLGRGRWDLFVDTTTEIHVTIIGKGFDISDVYIWDLSSPTGR